MANILSKTRRDMIEAGGRVCRVLGLPRSTGQIYGLLYLSPKPLSLDDMVELLAISKASTSMGTRQLSAWGAVRPVWVQGNRRDYYEAVAEVGTVMRGAFTEVIKPRLLSTQKRLDRMVNSLKDELAAGLLTQEEYTLCAARLKALARVQRQLLNLAPLAEKLI